jgi:hypothetical protein
MYHKAEYFRNLDVIVTVVLFGDSGICTAAAKHKCFSPSLPNIISAFIFTFVKVMWGIMRKAQSLTISDPK